jgi:hypothetical protein
MKPLRDDYPSFRTLATNDADGALGMCWFLWSPFEDLDLSDPAATALTQQLNDLTI